MIRHRAVVAGKSEDLRKVGRILFTDRFSRHAVWALSMFNDAQAFLSYHRNIRTTSTLIVGCGGIGSNVAMILAGCGFKKFVLLDGDVVEESNLNRQTVYSRRDIGRRKTSVLKNSLEARFPGLRIRCIENYTDVRGLYSLVKKSDVCVISANEPGNFGYMASALAEQNSNCLIVNAGYTVQFGRVIQLSKSDIRYARQKWSKPAKMIAASSGIVNYDVAAKTCLIINQYVAGFIKPYSKRIELAWDSTSIT